MIATPPGRFPRVATRRPAQTGRGRSLVALAALFALAACGIRTDPRPPEDTMARAATEVRAVRDGATVRVEWRSPGESVDGKSLRDLTAFVVERRVGDARFAPVAEVAADTTHRLRPVRNYTWVDEDPAGDAAEYRVVSYTADGQRGVPGAGVKVTKRADEGETPPPAEPEPTP